MSVKSGRSDQPSMPLNKKIKTPPHRRQRRRTKKQIAMALLQRAKGASIAELEKALGWQAHSVRGFLAGTIRKMPDIDLVSEKSNGASRRYRIVVSE